MILEGDFGVVGSVLDSLSLNMHLRMPEPKVPERPNMSQPTDPADVPSTSLVGHWPALTV